MKFPSGVFFQLCSAFPESNSSDRAFNCSTLLPAVLFKITFLSWYHAPKNCSLSLFKHTKQGVKRQGHTE